MNEGKPDQASTLASYRSQKNETPESEHSEKALLTEMGSPQSFEGPTKMSPSKNDDSSSLADRLKKHKDDAVSLPPGGASKAMADILKAAAEGKGDDDDFDMSMIPMSFPQRLFEILEDEGNAEAISWLPHGKGFTIHKKELFSEKVLPRYFKESKFTSFTRKLNRWGFSRVTRGSEAGSYYHPYFQKGNLRRTLLMQCTQRPNSKKKKAQPVQNPTAGLNLGLDALLASQLDGANPLARQLEQLQQQVNEKRAATLLGQREEQIIEQARTETRLRQEQEKLAKLEERQKGQQQDLNAVAGQVQTALCQYQNLIAQLGGGSSSIANQLPAPDQQQNLLAQLRAASSLSSPPLSGTASLSTAFSVPSNTTGRSSLGAAGGAATLGSAGRSPMQNSAGSSLAASDHASILDAANALKRSDPAAYMAVLLAAKQKAESRGSAAAASVPAPAPQPDARSILLQAQQDRMNEFLRQRLSQSPNLPPKKR